MRGMLPDVEFHNDWKSFARALTEYLAAPEDDRQFLRPQSFVVSELPAAVEDGLVIWVSNEIGGATLAYSRGGAWRRVRDDVVVS